MPSGGRGFGSSSYDEMAAAGFHPDEDGNYSDEQYAVYQQQQFELSAAREATEASMREAQLNRDYQTAASQLAMDFEKSEAEKNRQFILNQRETAYQTQVQDLKAAGLNPILAAFGSGAAVTSGAVGSGFSGSGSQGTAFAASGTRGNTDYTGGRELIQSLVSAAASIGAAFIFRNATLGAAGARSAASKISRLLRVKLV